MRGDSGRAFSLDPITGFETDPKSGCLSSISAAGVQMDVGGWGCEVGNWYGFFSQEKVGGRNVQVLDRSVLAGVATITARFEVALPRARVSLRSTETLHDGIIEREYSLEALDASYIGDFVLRSGFESRTWFEGMIGKYRLQHRHRDRMVQIKTKAGTLSSPDLRVVSALCDARFPQRFDLLTYLRDEPSGLWIIHHRLLTRGGDCDDYVLQMRGGYMSVNGEWLIPRIARRLLWRFSERNRGLGPTFQVGGNVRLSRGERLVLRSVLRLERACDSGATRA